MLSRRSLLIGAASLLVATRANALGSFASPGLWEAAMSMHAVEEGTGPVINILVARGCDKSGHAWMSTRSLVDRLRLRWIPVYEGIASNRPYVAAALDGGLQALEAVIIGDAEHVAVSDASLGAADEQDRLYQDVVARKLWESTGRIPAMPSYVYLDARGKAKVIDGALRPERYGSLLEEAR